MKQTRRRFSYQRPENLHTCGRCLPRGERRFWVELGRSLTTAQMTAVGDKHAVERAR